MQTTASFFNSISMTQIETLFGVLPLRHGKPAQKPDTKQPAQHDAAPTNAARNVSSETLQAIQSLISQASGAQSQSPVSPAAGYLSRTGALDFGDTATAEATIEGSLGNSSFSFSFSANRSSDSGTGLPAATSYSYSLSVDGHFVMSGWVDGGRDPSTDPVQIKLGFSYAETAYSAVRGGGQPSAEAEAFSTVAGQIVIDTGSLVRGIPMTSAESVRGHLFQSVALGKDLQISSSVAMTSGCLGCASALPSSSSVYSETAENWSSLLSSLQVTWGA